MRSPSKRRTKSFGVPRPQLNEVFVVDLTMFFVLHSSSRRFAIAPRRTNEGHPRRVTHRSSDMVAMATPDLAMTNASIWVDADACPKVIRDILYRAAERTGVTVTLVANQALLHPRIPSLRLMQVSAGFDVADNEIVKRVAAGDLVITADIPLAAEVIAKGGEALNPRGERYSPDTIRGVLIMRDFMDTMRSSANVGGGPPPLTQADRNAFASHLDKWLARRSGPS
jgi:uncharacterized protein YaiI (UPF0178 family)